MLCIVSIAILLNTISKQLSVMLVNVDLHFLQLGEETLNTAHGLYSLQR